MSEFARGRFASIEVVTFKETAPDLFFRIRKRGAKRAFALPLPPAAKFRDISVIVGVAVIPFPICEEIGNVTTADQIIVNDLNLPGRGEPALEGPPFPDLVSPIGISTHGRVPISCVSLHNRLRIGDFLSRTAGGVDIFEGESRTLATG